MPKLYLDNLLIIRSPSYSYVNFNEQFLREVLADDFFRTSMFFASQVFFNELKKKDFEFDLLHPQAQLTLWKYLNRMCYRSLPYGLFSSYSVLKWKDEQGQGLVFSENDEVSVRPDFKILAEYIRNLNPADFISLKYYTNNSLYASGKNLRLINQTYAAQQKFTVTELKTSPELNKLLKFIAIGRTKEEIIGFLTALYEDREMITSYVDSLVNGQVITSALLPNITGPNYGDRCSELLNGYLAPDQNRLRSFQSTIGTNRQPLPALNTLIDELNAANNDNSSYTFYKRAICGNLSAALKPSLLKLVAQMDRLSGDRDIDHMKTFKTDFLKKYDQQEAPLMEVLDPGMGIGYENLASAFDPQAEDFINDVRSLQKKQSSVKWGELEKMIFKKWNNLQQGVLDKIIINEEDLGLLPESEHPLPPGLFVLFKVIDEQIWLEHIAGVSGVELSARFGGEDADLQEGLRSICLQEMEINKEYIFAEIAFSPNDRASNINQRGHLYPYEIPVLCHSTLADEFIIRLNDLMVSVRDNKIYLRSKRLDKFIIPRLSSAYNYQISTVPVFRFLCDLQFQGIKSNLSFSLSDLFPGLDFYPRVEIGTTVVSPATWILNEEQLNAIIAGNNKLIEELKLPAFFILKEGDNFLVFNSGAASDWAVFRKCIKNKKSVTLMEHVFAEREILQDKDGQPFSSQIVACVLNGSKSYESPVRSLSKYMKNPAGVQRTFLPGQEWLYLKLYTHYSLTDEILIDLILPVIRKYKKKTPGFKWFFIRYKDPADHLRIRFLTNPELSLTLLADLMSILKPWTAAGKIADVLPDSYRRELEKYSPILINDVESFFYKDTEYILAAFSTINHRNTSFKLSFAVNSSLRIIHFFMDDNKQCLEFLNSVLDHISSEFDRGRDSIHKLDTKYRNFQKELISVSAIAAMQKNSKDYEQQILELVAKTIHWHRLDRHNLLINLVHMHINRIFERNSREYEYVIYHFMKKHQAYLNYKTNGVF